MPRNPIALIVLLLTLTGCPQQSVKPTIPEKVYVRVEVPAELPEKLTAPCPATRAKVRQVEAVVAAYNANVLALEDCDARMGEIRKLTRPATGQVKP